MKLDPKTTAVLSLDMQAGIIGMVSDASVIVGSAARATDYARKNGVHLIHVGIGFEDGYPEIPDHSGFARIKGSGMFIKGSPSAKFDESIAHAGDLFVYKQRVSAFSENNLNMLLRAKGVTDLVLFGLATSGIVLSTARRAYDLDYRMTILRDACGDTDDETHRVLLDKVLAKQATVCTVDEFIKAQT